MFLTGYLQPPTAPVQLLGFPFTWFLHVSYGLPFIYIVFTCFSQAPFFHLHGFYMFLTGPLYSFTWFLHVSYRPPFFIYMVFTCFLQAPFFRLHGFYRVTNITFPDFLQHSVELFTRFPHGLAKQFTCFLQRQILWNCVKYFTGFYMFFKWSLSRKTM